MRRPWGEVVAGVAGVVLGVDGSILDPENGKTYIATVWLDKRERLRVRGYWGPFYRTQSWRRAGGHEAESPGPGERPEGGRP